MRHAFIGLAGAAAVLCASTAMAQTARDIRGPAPVVPLAGEPAARIVIDPPLADSLVHGRVIIQYRAENLRIVPVFGPNALDVSPRIGHIHVTVDDAPWRWADASGEPLIINGLPAGPHKVLIELVNANHQTLDKGVVTFNDWHAVMAYLGAGRDVEIDRVIGALERSAGGNTDTARWAGAVALPLIRAFRAFWRGEYGACAEGLYPARSIVNQFGRSHAQRDAIDWTLTEAAVRGKLSALAEALAHERLALKPHSVVNRAFLRRARSESPE